MERPADYLHLLQHAWDLFPGSDVEITYTEDETIHIDVDGHRYTFEIGSDDDAYIFSDGCTSFSIHFFLIRPGNKPDRLRPPILIDVSFTT